MQENGKPMQSNRKKIWLLQAVSQIRKCYPEIKAADIRFAAMVFYPVASVEVVARERNEEDFDTVQLAVLRFFALGINEAAIAQLTGLTPTYIAKVRKLLRGYGHIAEDASVTPLGKDSIEAGKKITEDPESRRHIQLDALALSVIPYEKRIDENVFYEKRDARSYSTGVIAYPEGIEEEYLEMQLKHMDYSKLAGVEDIHVNIVAIEKMECLKLRYAMACMIVLLGSDTPMVFVRRVWQQGKKHKKDAFLSWVPFGTSDALRTRYGFDYDIRTVHDGTEYLLGMKGRFERLRQYEIKKRRRAAVEADEDDSQDVRRIIEEENQQMAEDKFLWDAISNFYPLDDAYCEWRDGNLFISGAAFGGFDIDPLKSKLEKILRNINEKKEETEEENDDLISLDRVKRRFVSSLARILLGFAEEGVFLLTTENLCGSVVLIYPVTGDILLEEVTALLKTAIDQYGGFLVDKKLRERFPEKESEVQVKGEKVLETLKRVLTEFLEGETEEEVEEDDG